jgi:hypothetical protein
MGVSGPEWPYDYHRHLATCATRGFFLHSRHGLWVVKSNGFAPPGPPGNMGANLAIPARPSGGAPEGLGTARFPKAGTRIEEAPHAPHVGAGAAPPRNLFGVDGY